MASAEKEGARARKEAKREVLARGGRTASHNTRCKRMFDSWVENANATDTLLNTDKKNLPMFGTEEFDIRAKKMLEENIPCFKVKVWDSNMEDPKNAGKPIFSSDLGDGLPLTVRIPASMAEDVTATNLYQVVMYEVLKTVSIRTVHCHGNSTGQIPRTEMRRLTDMCSESAVYAKHTFTALNTDNSETKLLGTLDAARTTTKALIMDQSLWYH